jgi:hypothetical protein
MQYEHLKPVLLQIFKILLHAVMLAFEESFVAKVQCETALCAKHFAFEANFVPQINNTKLVYIIIYSTP